MVACAHLRRNEYAFFYYYFNQKAKLNIRTNKTTSVRIWRNTDSWHFPVKDPLYKPMVFRIHHFLPVRLSYSVSTTVMHTVT